MGGIASSAYCGRFAERYEKFEKIHRFKTDDPER